MSENADLVRRLFEAFDRAGLDAVVPFWHENIDWRSVEGAADDAGVLKGREAMRRYYQDWADTFDDIHTTVEEVALDESDELVVQLRASGRGRESGVPATLTYWVHFTIRGGVIVRGREYETPEEALAPALERARAESQT